MAERRTHVERVRAGTPVSFGAVTLLPIEGFVLDAGLACGRPWLTARKELRALIVRDALGTHALDRTAQPLPLAELRQQLPDLDAWLAKP